MRRDSERKRQSSVTMATPPPLPLAAAPLWPLLSPIKAAGASWPPERRRERTTGTAGSDAELPVAVTEDGGSAGACLAPPPPRWSCVSPLFAPLLAEQRWKAQVRASSVSLRVSENTFPLLQLRRRSNRWADRSHPFSSARFYRLLL